MNFGLGVLLLPTGWDTSWPHIIFQHFVRLSLNNFVVFVCDPFLDLGNARHIL